MFVLEDGATEGKFCPSGSSFLRELHSVCAKLTRGSPQWTALLLGGYWWRAKPRVAYPCLSQEFIMPIGLYKHMLSCEERVIKQSLWFNPFFKKIVPVLWRTTPLPGQQRNFPRPRPSSSWNLDGWSSELMRERYFRLMSGELWDQVSEDAHPSKNKAWKINVNIMAAQEGNV